MKQEPLHHRLLRLEAHFKHAARVYLFPFPWRPKELAAAFLTQQLLYNGLGMAWYPDPDQVLERQGIQVRTIIDTSKRPTRLFPTFVKPHPRSHTKWDALHESTAFPTILGPLMAFSDYTMSYAFPDLGAAATTGCTIYFAQRPFDQHALRLSMNGHDPTLFSQPNVDIGTSNIQLTLVFEHERIHCEKHNSYARFLTLVENRPKLTIDLEKEADLLASERARTTYGKNYFFYLRAMVSLRGFDVTHDNILDMDDLRQGKENRKGNIVRNITSVQELTKEYNKMLHSDLFSETTKKLVNTPDNNNVPFLQAILLAHMARENKTLSPDAKRRAELHLEGYAFFNPQRYQALRPYLSSTQQQRLEEVIRENHPDKVTRFLGTQHKPDAPTPQ